MGSKNNPNNRGQETAKKTVGGREVEPIMFVGAGKESGKFMAAKFAKTNDLVLDEKGNPVRWTNISSEA